MTVDVGAGPDRLPLDVEVAERVLGWSRAPAWGGASFRGVDTNGHSFHYDLVRDPSFSTTWEGAGLVVQALADRGWHVSIGYWSDGASCGVSTNPIAPFPEHEVRAHTVPEAVARAALAAIEAGGEDD